MRADLGKLEPLREAIANRLADGPYSPAVLHAMIVLTALPDGGAGLTASDVARQLDLPQAVAEAYLERWRAAGLIEQAEPGRYVRMLVVGIVETLWSGDPGLGSATSDGREEAEEADSPLV